MVSRRAFLRGAATARAAVGSAFAFQAAPEAAKMSLEEKVGQLFLLAFEGAGTGTPETLLGKYLVGSVYLSQDNLTSVAESVALMAKLQRIGAATPHGIPIFAGCDQEGAWCILDREATRGPGNFALGAAPPWHTEAMYRVMGQELRALGIAADLAPVSDVNSNPRNPIIGARSFGQDPKRVAAHVAAAVRGLHAGGAMACAKHFPGHGNTGQDSHRGLATVGRSRDEIETGDLVPFRAAVEAGVDIVMTAHLLYPAFDAKWPATLSPGILKGILRDRLGFRGVILTDSFSMGAIRKTYAPDEAVIRAINAGADLVMLAEERYGDNRTNYLTDQIALIEEIRTAAQKGSIPESRLNEAVGRVLSLKQKAGLFTKRSPDLAEARSVVGAKDHRRVEMEAARAAVTIFRDREHRLPLKAEARRKIVLVSPIAADSYGSMRKMRGIGPNVSEPPTDVLFAAVRRRSPDAEFLRIINANTVGEHLQRLRAASAVIVATENYPLPGFDFPTAPQRAIIRLLVGAGLSPIVVGLRDPYELLELSDVKTYLSALGYAPACAEAAAEVLFGERSATGTPDFKG